MKLAELLAGVELTGPTTRNGAAVDLSGPAGEIDVAEVRDDSRAVGAGDLFVAISGTATDGRRFVADAVGRGAAAVVIEGASGSSALVPPEFSGVVVMVSSARRALAFIAANRFGAASALTLTAVTGTNGKTTTTYLLEAMLQAAGIVSGVVGTITYRVSGDGSGGPGWSRPAPLTTPGALTLHGAFADMGRAGATDVVLEASSHALDQGRLDGCSFRVAGLTNLTQDHLDYHGSMERYFEAKAILFQRLLDARAGVAVLPVDLPEGRAMRARLVAAGAAVGAAGGAGRTARVLGVAVVSGTPDADVIVETASFSAAGMSVRLATPLGPLSFVSPLVGDYNLANIVLAVGMAIARGLPAAAIVTGLERLHGVPGRLERVDNGAGVLCVVDYAHTPDALKRSLAAVRPLVGAGGRLLTVFGCGGDRDRGKRPLMGEVAATNSDLSIVTSDNPRSEDPAAIIAMIVEGARQGGAVSLDTPGELAEFTGRGAFHVAPDRRTAIQRAVAAARRGDVLVIAGKGHEDYQIIGADRIHFDDREEAAAAFAAKQGVEAVGSRGAS